jgi:hypothetical protein
VTTLDTHSEAIHSEYFSFIRSFLPKVAPGTVLQECYGPFSEVGDRLTCFERGVDDDGSGHFHRALCGVMWGALFMLRTKTSITRSFQINTVRRATQFLYRENSHCATHGVRAL